jgi:hypothetical protein
VSLPKHLARTLVDEIESGGVPAIMLRGIGQVNPDGVRDYDVLVPATVEALVLERSGRSRDRLLAEADEWRDGLIAAGADGANGVVLGARADGTAAPAGGRETPQA